MSTQDRSPLTNEPVAHRNCPHESHTSNRTCNSWVANTMASNTLCNTQSAPPRLNTTTATVHDHSLKYQHMNCKTCNSWVSQIRWRATHCATHKAHHHDSSDAVLARTYDKLEIFQPLHCSHSRAMKNQNHCNVENTNHNMCT